MFLQGHQELSAGQRTFLRRSDLSGHRKGGQRGEDVTAVELLGSHTKYFQTQSSIKKQLRPLHSQLVCNQRDLLNSSCSDEEE